MLQAETAKDNTLQKLKSYIDKGTFNKTDKTLQPYFAIRNNISTFNNLVMFNEKIIIPSNLQQKMITIAHEGHQGMTRTVQRLRRTVWWPKLKYQVEHFIKNCHDCQVIGPLPPPTPLIMTDIPEGSWLLVGCDLCGPFPTGESLLVCIDYYSRYPEVEILHKTKASVITSKLRKLFCRYGAPETLVTDNGPQFKNNSEFKALMTEFDIHHRRVTPYHPIANGEVKRFNRNLKKCIQTSISKGIDWRISLQNFLLNYRNTIHSTTGVTPAELLFGRPLRDKLPSPSQRITDKNQLNQAAVSKDIASKAAIKSYADTKRKASEHHIKIGQQVLITNNSPHRNKYTTKWDKTPRTVTQVKGNSIIMDSKGKSIMRSSRQVKPYHNNNKQPVNNNNISSNNSSDSESDETNDNQSDTETIPYQRNLSEGEDINDIPTDNEADNELSDNEGHNTAKRIRAIPKKLLDYVLE